MGTEQNEYLGLVLQFNETRYKQALEQWDTVLKPVNEAIQFFHSLNIGSLSKIDYKDFLKGDLTGIERLYRKSVDDNLKNLQITAKAVVDSFKQNIASDLKQMAAKLFAINKLIIDESKDGYNLRGHICLVELEGDKAVLPEKAKEVIKKTFQVIIETENQAEIYGLYLEAKEAVHRLKEKAYAPYGFGFPFMGYNNAMFPMDSEGELGIVPTVLYHTR